MSIVKACARIAGHDAGAVRPPLTDLAAQETGALATLIAAIGLQ